MSDDDTFYVHDGDRLVGLVRHDAYGDNTGWMAWQRNVYAPDGWEYLGAFVTREAAVTEFGVAQ